MFKEIMQELSRKFSFFFFEKCSEEHTMEDVCLGMIGGINGVIVEWSMKKKFEIVERLEKYWEGLQEYM